MKQPLWIYGEDGIEIPFNDLPVQEDEFIEVDFTHDKKLLWKVKKEFLWAAIKFFFTGK